MGREVTVLYQHLVDCLSDHGSTHHKAKLWLGLDLRLLFSLFRSATMCICCSTFISHQSTNVSLEMARIEDFYIVCYNSCPACSTSYIASQTFSKYFFIHQHEMQKQMNRTLRKSICIAHLMQKGTPRFLLKKL